MPERRNQYIHRVEEEKPVYKQGRRGETSIYTVSERRNQYIHSVGEEKPEYTQGRRGETSIETVSEKRPQYIHSVGVGRSKSFQYTLVLDIIHRCKKLNLHIIRSKENHN